MFTGIVTDIGQVESIQPLDQGIRLRIGTNYDPATIDIGASIACSGVCLTVVTLPEAASNQRWFEVEAWEEALRLTTAGSWKEGTKINLERALKVGDELGGHIVSGHVDGKGDVTRFEQVGESWNLSIRVPQSLGRYMAYKGSVTVNGVSLTVNSVEDQTEGCEISINLIPHTVQVTTLKRLKPGAAVNIEIDMIARYCERLLGARLAADGE